MLQAAQAQLRQGVKLRAGVVETHSRAETESLLAGVPQQPLRSLEYRGMKLQEMDLDGLLADPPALALVDELAHSNVPGSRHAKRWQDIQELLAAGIDVYTTVNVQHLESLNDQVRDITGVQVRETVPDWVLQEAYEIVLIDLPPRELLERLREGKVYVPEQARAAIDAFFSQTNLTALRELAMQTAAARVDADLNHRYRQRGEEAPALRGRLLVGIDGDEQAERLVRHACRVAERRHLPWSVVHVDTGGLRGEHARMRLQGAQQLAERLGGEIVVLRAGEVARTLLQHARERRASLVLVGQSRRRWYRRAFGGGLAGRLLRDGQGLEISALDSEADLRPAEPRPRYPVVWNDYLLALLATALASGLAWVVAHLLELPNISLVFLMAVLLVAVRSSLMPALLCAVASFLAYDFLFIPPHFSFAIHRHEDLLSLAFFLFMAGLTGNLAARQRRQLRRCAIPRRKPACCWSCRASSPPPPTARRCWPPPPSSSTTGRTSRSACSVRSMASGRPRPACSGNSPTRNGSPPTGPGPTTSRPASVRARCPEDAGGGGRCLRKRDRWHCSASRRWTASR